MGIKRIFVCFSSIFGIKFTNFHKIPYFFPKYYFFTNFNKMALQIFFKVYVASFQNRSEVLQTENNFKYIILI